MRDEYMIERQGKKFVLYPGLLAEAHERFDGFTIHTEIIDDGERPIVKCAFLGMREGKEPIKTSGIGTAGRQSDRKGPAVDAPIEMAETRAKARALRDAVNVGVAAFEELSDGGEASQPQKRSQASQTGNEWAAAGLSPPRWSRYLISSNVSVRTPYAPFNSTTGNVSAPPMNGSLSVGW